MPPLLRIPPPPTHVDAFIVSNVTLTLVALSAYRTPLTPRAAWTRVLTIGIGALLSAICAALVKPVTAKSQIIGKGEKIYKTLAELSESVLLLYADLCAHAPTLVPAEPRGPTMDRGRGEHSPSPGLHMPAPGVHSRPHLPLPMVDERALLLQEISAARLKASAAHAPPERPRPGTGTGAGPLPYPSLSRKGSFSGSLTPTPARVMLSRIGLKGASGAGTPRDEGERETSRGRGTAPKQGPPRPIGLFSIINALYPHAGSSVLRSLSSSRMKPAPAATDSLMDPGLGLPPREVPSTPGRAVGGSVLHRLMGSTSHLLFSGPLQASRAEDTNLCGLHIGDGGSAHVQDGQRRPVTLLTVTVDPPSTVPRVSDEQDRDSRPIATPAVSPSGGHEQRAAFPWDGRLLAGPAPSPSDVITGGSFADLGARSSSTAPPALAPRLQVNVEQIPAGPLSTGSLRDALAEFHPDPLHPPESKGSTASALAALTPSSRVPNVPQDTSEAFMNHGQASLWAAGHDQEQCQPQSEIVTSGSQQPLQKAPERNGAAPRLGGVNESLGATRTGLDPLSATGPLTRYGAEGRPSRSPSRMHVPMDREHSASVAPTSPVLLSDAEARFEQITALQAEVSAEMNAFAALLEASRHELYVYEIGSGATTRVPEREVRDWVRLVRRLLGELIALSLSTDPGDECRVLAAAHVIQPHVGALRSLGRGLAAIMDQLGRVLAGREAPSSMVPALELVEESTGALLASVASKDHEFSTLAELEALGMLLSSIATIASLCRQHFRAASRLYTSLHHPEHKLSVIKLQLQERLGEREHRRDYSRREVSRGSVMNFRSIMAREQSAPISAESEEVGLLSFTAPRSSNSNPGIGIGGVLLDLRSEMTRL